MTGPNSLVAQPLPVLPRAGYWDVCGERSRPEGWPPPVGLVDVFRPSEQTPDIARQAVAAGATALWLQLGVASAEARTIAEDAGLLYVENHCLVIEQRRTGLSSPTPAS